MLKLNKFVRVAILALALLGLAGGAAAVTHAPTMMLGDSGSGTIDVG